MLEKKWFVQRKQCIKQGYALQHQLLISEADIPWCTNNPLCYRSKNIAWLIPIFLSSIIVLKHYYRSLYTKYYCKCRGKPSLCCTVMYCCALDSAFIIVYCENSLKAFILLTLFKLNSFPIRFILTKYVAIYSTYLKLCFRIRNMFQGQYKYFGIFLVKQIFFPLQKSSAC